MDYKEKYEKVCEYFNECANHIAEVDGAETLMKVAVYAGFTKEECLEWFIDDEDLYERVREELADED